MDCPQCEGTLATYALGGREASVCEDCGYVGIAAEHRGDPRSVESWDDALRRFYRAHGGDGAPSVELEPPLSRPARSANESWDDALRRFYARQGAAADDDTESSEKVTGNDPDSGDGTVDDGESDAQDDGVEADAGGR